MCSMCGFLLKQKKGTVLTILVWLVAPARQDQFFQQVGGVRADRVGVGGWVWGIYNDTWGIYIDTGACTHLHTSILTFMHHACVRAHTHRDRQTHTHTHKHTHTRTHTNQTP